MKCTVLPCTKTNCTALHSNWTILVKDDQYTGKREDLPQSEDLVTIHLPNSPE